MTSNPGFSGCWLQNSAKKLDGCAFASAVWTEKGNGFALVNFQIKTANRFNAFLGGKPKFLLPKRFG
jgi:hypothetical protein